MAVSKRTRYEVLRRDNFTCRYCRSTDNALTIEVKRGVYPDQRFRYMSGVIWRMLDDLRDEVAARVEATNGA